MKTPVYVALIIVASALSIGVQAIPPAPPSLVQKKNVAKKIQCRDIKDLTVEEMSKLEENSDKVISFDQESGEICFK